MKFLDKTSDGIKYLVYTGYIFVGLYALAYGAGYIYGLATCYLK